VRTFHFKLLFFVSDKSPISAHSDGQKMIAAYPTLRSALGKRDVE
jgi:hypothetical protein